MANTPIQIKRSLTSNTPATLNVGEPAYSYSSNTLFIGTPGSDGPIIIGGYDSYIRGVSAYERLNTAFDSVNAASLRANNTVNANTGGTITGNLTILGNLNIIGGSIGANVPIVLIGDNIITLNAAINQSGTPTMNAGIEIDRGVEANVYLLWNEVDNKWQFTNDGISYDDLGGSAPASYANSAFVKANSAFLHANYSFNHANSGFIQANSAFHHANYAFANANAGLAMANAAFIRANSGFIQANSSFFHVNAAYLHANAAYTSQNTSGIRANSAFEQANAAFIHANSAFQFQNTSGNYANSGFIQANSAYHHANAAFANANGAFAAANAAYIQANSAFIRTNAAFIHANSGFIKTNSAFDHANAAFANANGAFARANAAFANANAAFAAANASHNTANAAFIRANNSLNANVGGQVTGDVVIVGNVTSNTLTTTGSNGSITGANAIFTNYIFAANGNVDLFIYSSLAYANANAALARANAAFSNANGAFAAANAAYIHANSGFIQANASFGHANAAYISQNATGQYANAAFIRANNSLDANVGGVITGNVTVTQNLTVTGNISGNYFIGDGSQLTGISTSFDLEMHVSKDGNDSTGTGTILRPYLTITHALTQVNGDRNTIVIHPGGYTENPTITSLATQLITYDATGASTLVYGTVTIANTTGRIAGLKMTNLAITGNAQAYINSSTVDEQFTKSSSGYVEVDDCELQVTGNVLISGSGITTIIGNKINNLVVNNAGASVLIKGANDCVMPQVIAGSLNIVDSIIRASSNTANAVTASVGTVVTLMNNQIVTPAADTVARVSIAGYHSIISVVYDKANSTLSNSLNSVGYFQTVNADKVTLSSGGSLVFPDSTIQITAAAPYAYSNAAYAQANSGFIQANAAFIHSNSAYESQNATGQYANAAFIRANNSIDANGGGVITGNLTVTNNLSVGNLFVTGQVVSINASTLVSNDTLIILGSGNYVSDLKDLGFAGHYNDGTNAHSGLIRDFADKEWYLFKGYTPEIGGQNNVDLNDPSFEIDTLNANLRSTFITIKKIDILPRTNIIFDLTNSAFIHANSGFVHANSAFVHANAAYQSQNATGQYANSAFVHANSAYESQNATGQYANAAFVVANGATANAASAGTYANASFNTGNSAFIQANASFNHANAAFAAANNVFPQVQPAFNTANAAFIQANASFDKANNADANALSAGVYANSAYVHANAAFAAANNVFPQIQPSYDTANAAFLQANGAIVHAQSAFNAQNTTGQYANAAFAHANAAFNSANNVAPQVQPAFNAANAAFIHANASFDKANNADANALSAGAYANAAFAAANNVAPQVQPSFDTANAAFIQANASILHAQSAFHHANSGFDAANTADGKAVTASNRANAAFIVANATTIQANASFDHANSGFVQANSAFFHANSGFIQANASYNQANASFIVANATSSQANAAFDHANAAFASANNVAPQVQPAFNTANAAFIQANASFIVANATTIQANAAFDHANAAFASANNVAPQVQPAFNTANSAFIQANAAFDKANTGANAEVTTFTTTSNGAVSTYALGFTPASNSAVIVSIGGIVQLEQDDYLVNRTNNSISFNEPPPAGQKIRVAGFNNVNPYFLDVANSAGAVVSTYSAIGDGSTQGYNIGFRPESNKAIFVSIGGILQPETAYTVNPSTNTVTFGTAPGNNENIRIVGFEKINPYFIQYVSSNVSVSVFETTSNGTTATFNLGFNPQARETLIVTIDGIVQSINDYTVNTATQTITLDEIPASGELVRVATMYTTANAFVIADGSITSQKLETSLNTSIQSAATTGKAIAMSIVFGG